MRVSKHSTGDFLPSVCLQTRVSAPRLTAVCRVNWGTVMIMLSSATDACCACRSVGQKRFSEVLVAFIIGLLGFCLFLRDSVSM